MAKYVSLTDIIQQEDRYDINKITFFTRTGPDNLIIRDTDLFTIYRKYIDQYVGTYAVSDSQRRIYECKPEFLSQDLYGTPKLSWMILALNNMECPSKFYIKSTIKLIPPESIEFLYDTIVTKSHKRLQENHNEYLPDVEYHDEGI